MKKLILFLLLIVSAPAFADRTIHQFPDGSAAQAGDELPIQRGTTGTFSYKLNLGQIRAYVLSGNAATASALAANPADCGADTYATAIDAQGNLSCASISSASLAGSIALSKLATQSANTVVANVSGSTAAPTAAALPSCSASSSALSYTSGTGFGCNTSIAAATATSASTATTLVPQSANTIVANATGSTAAPTAVAMPSCSGATSAIGWTTSTGPTCNSSLNAATLGGATFAAPGAIGGTTPAPGNFTTGGYSTSLNIPHGTSLPGSCNGGDQFQKTNNTSGQQHYLCEAGTWVVQGDGVGGIGGGGNPAGSVGDIQTKVDGTTFGSITPGANVATALGVNIGSAGAMVLFNGAAGTPSSMVGTNITGTAAGLTAGTASAVAVGGITGLGTGCATWLATPSSANLRACLTDEVGTGAFYTVGGALGTPASGTATNLTGLPLAGLVNATAASKLIGRQSGSSGAWGEITLGTGLSMSGSTLSATGGGSGDVVGPASATDGNVALFDGATGKLIKDSGSTLVTAGTLTDTNLCTYTASGTTIGCTTPTSTFQAADSDLTSWAAITRASGFDTFTATPSGANLASLLTSALTVAKGGTGATTLTGPLKGNGTSAFTAAAAADIYGLWSGTCSSSTYLRGDGSCQSPAGSGDFSSNTSSSVDGEALLFSGTGGKTGKRSTLTAAVVKSASGIHSAAVAADVYGLWSGTCNASSYLRGDGACASPGGSGTVTNTVGNLTANSVVLGAGTADTKVIAGITTDGVSQINLGVANTTLGKLKFFGNTSGDVTVSPAAAAGTATALLLPATSGTLALTSDNVATATALAANPADCSANNFATAIAANGDLTCGQPSISSGVSGLGTSVATALGVNIGSAGAPVLFNGAGGTPSSMVGTNITGTAAGLTAGTASAVAVGGITGLGTGCATWLATPSSANLRACLTDEVGTGAFYTVGGALGTPASGTATNLTGLPLAGLVNATAASKLIGRQSGSSGAWGEITLGTGLSMSGSTLSATGGGSGDVVGPASATDGNVALFDGATGKLIKDGGTFVQAGTLTNGNLCTYNSTGPVQDCNTPTSTFQAADSDLTSWAAITRASGFDTFTATPSGANLASLLSSALTVAKGGTGATTLTGPLKGNGTSAFTAAAAADIYGLWSGTCNASSYLRGDGACAAPGGSGTVTNTGGNLTANAVVLGAGTADTKVVAGITTDGASQLNLGVASTTLGKLKLFGNTSGDVTIQPNAAAGTATVVTLPASSTTIPIATQQLTIAGPTAARTITVPDAAFTVARSDAAQTFTGTQTITQIDLGNTDTSLTRSAAGVLAVEGVVIPSVSSTSTLTNKRVTPRVGTTASSSTPTPDSDANDTYTVTALAANATFGAPTGTPTDGQTLLIRIKDNGTARTLAFNAAYRASSDLALPTTTVLSKTMYLSFMWNSADSKWDLTGKLDNF